MQGCLLFIGIIVIIALFQEYPVFSTFFLIAMIITFVISFYSEKKNFKEYEEELIPFLEQNNFKLSKRIKIFPNTLEFFVDDENKKFGIMTHRKNEEPEYLLRRYNYTDLIDFELWEDCNSALTGRGLAATGGALLFGVAGAVIGSVAGDKKIKKTDRSIIVNIQMNRLDTPLISIDFQASDNELCYKKQIELARNLISVLAYIKNSNDTSKTYIANNENIDISDKIKKLIELKEQGLINEEEFLKKKNKLIEDF